MDSRVVSRRALLTTLIGAGAAASATAQDVKIYPGPQGKPIAPEVLSGPDIGFRVDRVGRGGSRVGALVVRANGEWVEAELAPTFRRGTTV